MPVSPEGYVGNVIATEWNLLRVNNDKPATVVAELRPPRGARGMGQGARTVIRTFSRWARGWTAAILLSASVAACGGGGGGGDAGGGGAPTPPTSAPITDAEAAKFLTQSTFGPTEADITNVKNQGYAAWLTSQFAASSPSHLSYLDSRLIQLQASNPSATLNSTHFYESFWRYAATGDAQLRERIKFAYSQIFVISMVDPNINVRGAASYYDMLGANAFGNFRQLLEAVTLHPQMGIYLTYMANQREDPTRGRTPDENYAREVMQLMTIGLHELNADGTVRTDGSGQPIPTYGEADISGLAKVFTGISWYHPTPSNNTFFGQNRDPESHTRPMIFYPQYHSNSAKSFLGTTIAAGSTDVGADLKVALDTLFNHPNVGPFIGKQLIQRLVTSNPSPAYVGRVTAVFNNNGSGVRGDMAAVIRAILTDAEARAAPSAGTASSGKLREPIIRLANWMRAFGATSVSGNWLVGSTSANTSLAQSPLASPSVFNFYRPGYVPPNTRLGAQNLLAPEFQIVDEVSVAGYANTMQTAIGTGIGSGSDVRAGLTAEMAIANDPDALAERLNRLLLYGQMSSGLKTRIITAVNGVTIPSGGSTTQAQIDAARLNRARLAVYLVMVSPEYLVQR